MHIPVLLNEILEYLNPKPGQRFVDATVDGGGHALAILERITPSGKLLGIEWDKELLERTRFKIYDLGFKNNSVFVNDTYVNLKKIAEKNNFIGANGVLFDLGMSSWHLESAGRGFSFQKDEPLDMRYDSQSPYGRSITAEEIINKYSFDNLVIILKEYGEEKFAKSIAARIVKTRKEQKIRTTYELIEIIKNSVPFWYRRGRLHFATRTFQAIRIAVNDELKNIESGIKQAVEILAPGSRLAVITFHSLEDRIAKNLFRTMAKDGKVLIVTKKPVSSSLAEVTSNPRARSAKLRVAEKI